MKNGLPAYMAPVDAPRSVHMWKALAPHVYLEEQLFAFDAAAPDRDAEAFITLSLPEANPLGRVA